jgi:formylglycine-generating enzyme required for sulfatase activity
VKRSPFSTYSVTLAAAALVAVIPSAAFQTSSTTAKTRPTVARKAESGTLKAGGQAKSTDTKAATKPGEVRVNPVDQQRYVWIPAGKYTAGCSTGDNECFEDEYPQRNITLTRGFWLAETEVTQAAYDRVVDYDPSFFVGPTLPVENVTWDEANAFCQQIGGRLPSEWEWEYAARAGGNTARYGKLDDIAWYYNNSKFATHPVKLKAPNAFGLYDMLGNVVEWTYTFHTVQHSQETINPQGPSYAEYKTLRGSGWWDDPELTRVSYRRWFNTTDFDYNIGFRCVSNFGNEVPQN